MNDKINGIIRNGAVYIENRQEALSCCDCALSKECEELQMDEQFCTFFGASTSNDFNYKFSQELTDKLNGK